jgi:hypothetical protein
MAPCAPKRQFYDKQLVPPPEELLNAETLGLTPVGPHAKFYLLDSGPFQLEPRITSCFFDALGGDVASDEFDFLLSPSKVGHLADFALLKVRNDGVGIVRRYCLYPRQCEIILLYLQHTPIFVARS